MSSPLDRFIPHPLVRERFETIVKAPAEVVMTSVTKFDMQSIAVVRLIFRLRQVIMRAAPIPERVPQELLTEMRSIGWAQLATVPGRTMVFGAVCQPWRADVVFTPLPPDDFREYSGPGQVKIAWSFEAEPLNEERTRLVHETRATATDEESRLEFLRYWRWARFGIITIRLLLMPAVRRAAERRWRAVQRSTSTISG